MNCRPSLCSQWYVGHLEPGNSRVVKGPGPIDTRFEDGGTPTTYPADGTSFLMPLAPPYDSVTVITCGSTWAYFQPGGMPLKKHTIRNLQPCLMTNARLETLSVTHTSALCER